MLRNYLRITIRNITRNKGFSFINIAGLAIGMAAFVLITLFVQHEMSFDSMHEKQPDVYRMLLDAQVADQTILTASSPAVMAGTFIDVFPEVIDATRIDNFSAGLLITYEGESFYEEGFFLADSSVFNLFSLPLIAGDAPTALNQPNTIVIAASVAKKYFGNDDPMGKTIQVDNNTDYTVTGVMEDVPANTHFRPRLIGSFITSGRADDPVWLNNSFFTYLLLQPGTDPSSLEAKFPAFIREHIGPQIEQFMGQPYDAAIEAGLKYDWKTENLGDIYLRSVAEDQLGPTGDIRYLYILSAIALFVLIIACINFMNLSTARATGRAREVGIRKVMGSQRAQLIRQFLGESITMAFISIVLAFGLVLAALPYFSSVTGVTFTLAPWLFGAMVVIAAATGLLAGFYPALVLSGFQPATVLKGTFARSKHGKVLRSSLVVFQFAITIVLLVGTLVVNKQMRFIQDRDLGFAKEQIVVVPIETFAGLNAFDTFRENLLSHSAIVNAASGGLMPGPDRIHNNTGFRGEDMRAEDFFIAGLGAVSNDYVETLDLTLVAGRDFDIDFPSDSAAWVINVSAASQMGWSPEEAIGKTLWHLGGMPDDSDREGHIIGVVEDAHYESLHANTRPIVMGHWNRFQRYAPIRIRPENVSQTLAYIEEQWTTLEPGFPFRYYFLDQDYQRFYEQEERLGNLYFSFAVLAIVIACLGLFGLASFVTTLRTKEIGIRKVLGASVPGVVVLLSKEFTYLVLFACAVGFPIAWYAMNQWLQDFAYATELGVTEFLITGVSALLIAWMTVSYQSIRAAMTNPVNALQHE